MGFGFQIPSSWENSYQQTIPLTDPATGEFDTVFLEYVPAKGEPAMILSVTRVSESEWATLNQDSGFLATELGRRDGSVYYAQTSDTNPYPGEDAQRYQQFSLDVPRILATFVFIAPSLSQPLDEWFWNRPQYCMPLSKSLPQFSTAPFFFGAIFFMVGVFAAGRVVINIQTMSQYPLQGVLPVSLALTPNVPYPQRAEDCTYSPLYYEPDGRSTRQPTEMEQKTDEDNQQRCLDSLEFNRQNAKHNDVATAAFFLLLGVGLLASLPFYRR